MNNLPVWFERVESAALTAAIAVGFVHLHFAWWWLFACFVAFDVSAIGYLKNNRLGAICYDAVHSYIGPAALLGSFLLLGVRWCAFLGLAWAFHVAVDRLLGYGLKFTTGFQDTHLGRIGK